MKKDKAEMEAKEERVKAEMEAKMKAREERVKAEMKAEMKE